MSTDSTAAVESSSLAAVEQPSPPEEPDSTHPDELPSHRLQCLEVWGGNRAVDTRAQTAGLDFWALSRPHDEVEQGGDVFYVSSCSSGRITRALLADVMGHGSAAAEAAARLRDLMHRSVNVLSQSRLVGLLNEEFTSLRDGGRFASAVVLSYFRPSGKLSICNAGHPPPLLFRSGIGRWEVIDHRPAPAADGAARPLNLPLGMLDGVSYECFELALEPDDVALLYTDGLIEELDEGGEPLEVEGLLALARELDPGRPEELPAALLAAVRGRRSEPLADDTSIVVLCRNEERTSLRDELLAPLRFVGHGLGLT